MHKYTHAITNQKPEKTEKTNLPLDVDTVVTDLSALMANFHELNFKWWQ